MVDENSFVTVRMEEGVGILLIDNPPVNALSDEVAAQLLEQVTKLDEDENVRAMVVSAVGRTFVAGADIVKFQRMIEKRIFSQGAGLYQLTNRIEQASKPIVCAMFGTTLGGGLELALACHYRVAAAGTSLGLPEVKLGLIPGAGGTQRLPRLVGPTKAAEICGLGESFLAEQGAAWGVVDHVVESAPKEPDGDALLREAVQFALRVSNDPVRRTGQLTDRLSIDSSGRSRLSRLRDRCEEVYQGAVASSLAIDAVEKAIELSIEDGLAIENEHFVKALSSEEARTLIYLFFAERQATRLPKPDGETQSVSIENVAFQQLLPHDVSILEPLLRSNVPVAMLPDQVGGDPLDPSVEPPPIDHAQLGFDPAGTLLVVHSIDPKTTRQIDCIQPAIVMVAADRFDVKQMKSCDISFSNIVGVKATAKSELGNAETFVELAVTAETEPAVVSAVGKFLKSLGIRFVVEMPVASYASDRIAPYRQNLSDLKIEAWTLVNEKTVRQISDVDVIQAHVFSHPRHQCNLGLMIEATEV